MSPFPCGMESNCGRIYSFLRVTNDSQVLVYRTPYGKHNAEKDYETFSHAAERGYAVVIQDVRGRYASEGEFVAYQQEGHDGYDTIEWAAAQSWSNGSVGTFGLSFPGAVQWLAAIENPSLEGHGSGHDFFYSSEFLLCLGHLGHVVDRLDLEQYCARHSRKKEFAWSENSQEAADAWKDVAPVATANCPSPASKNCRMLHLTTTNGFGIHLKILGGTGRTAKTNTVV